MATAAIRANEIRFAYYLLTFLHASSGNAYLLLAIVAWVRGESGRTTGVYAGNNPLNLFVSGRRATFSTLRQAASATARRLLTADAYNLIQKIAQRGAAPGTEQQTQAMDLLQAIAMSNWDKNHYGAGAWLYNLHDQPLRFVFDATKNSLLVIWSKLLGGRFTIPADVLPQPKPPAQEKLKPVHIPRNADRRVPTPQQNDYLQPYEARSFLDARWRPLEPLG